MDLSIEVWLGLWLGVGCPVLGGMPPWVGGRTAAGRRTWAIVQALLAVGVTRGLFLPWGDGLDAVGSVLMKGEFWLRGGLWELGALMGVVLGGAVRGRSLQPALVMVGYGLNNPISAGLVALFWGVAVLFFRRSQQAWGIGLLALLGVTILRSPHDHLLIVMTGLFAAVLYFASQVTERSRATGKGGTGRGMPGRSVAQPTGRSLRNAGTPMGRAGNFLGRGEIPEIPMGRLGGSGRSEELALFRADGGVAKLGDELSPRQAGQPAAFLSELVRDGYAVPETWVIVPGDDLEPVIAQLQPTRQHPVQISYSSLGDARMGDSDGVPVAEQALWEAFNPGDFRGTIVKAFDRSREPVALMVRSKLWPVFAGTVMPVMPGYWLVTVGAERFEVRSDGSISGDGAVPMGLVQEVAMLFQTIQQQYAQQIQRQFGRSVVMEWQHDGETLWIVGLR